MISSKQPILGYNIWTNLILKYFFKIPYLQSHKYIDLFIFRIIIEGCFDINGILF